jgi:sucrose-6-phosphate hydrolase SacC (GH32 family)
MNTRLFATVSATIFTVCVLCTTGRAETACKATASASSLYNNGFQAEYAADGDRGTRWCSSEPYGKQEWLQVDLGDVRSIGRVEIFWEVAYARGYQLSTSDDAKDWVVVFKTGKGNGERDVVNGLKASGRYLRLDCLERGTDHGFSIWEFEVFAEAMARSDGLEDVLTHDPTYEPPVITARQLELLIEKKYLNIPLRNGAAKRNMTIKIDGRLLGEFQTPLARSEPDYYGFFDLSRYRGKMLAMEVNAFPRDLDHISLDDEIKGSEELYREKYRPQFHFTSRRGWLNDPNGLIYYKGLYHMYYQHNPVGLPWGNMTWGHAVSKDLVHWEEQPKVLFPDPKTGTCFSGAAFIDRWNQLGKAAGPQPVRAAARWRIDAELQQTAKQQHKRVGDEDVLVAFYLRTSIGLCLAYSNDAGHTFTDYEGNPVLTHEGARIDTPRPFWYEPTGRWIAPTYDFFTNDQGKRLRCVGFYSSQNLTDWKFESRVEQDKWGDELCGCVDFFQLPVDGDPANKKWVMILIDGSYIVGTFDGHVFYTLAGKPAATADRERSLVVKGNYYATMTWENVPNDRRVQITWMQGGQYPGMPFNQQMTIPAELTLHSTAEGPRLRMNPIKELESLRRKTHTWTDLVLKANENPLDELRGDLFDLEVEFQPGAGTQTMFDLRGHKVVYDARTQTLSSGKLRTSLKPENGTIHLRMLLDRTSIEVFGNQGRVYLPLCILPDDENRSLNVSCARGEVKSKFMHVHELKSAWDE